MAMNMWDGVVDAKMDEEGRVDVSDQEKEQAGNFNSYKRIRIQKKQKE